MCGASVPVFGGVALDLCGLPGIGNVDAGSMVADLRAGTFGPDVEIGAPGEHGLTLGHWPQSMDLSTVGGWLACRGAGQYSNRYGKIEDMVIGLEVVLADGTVVRTGGHAPRSATGPDLTQLFVGSEGTLGVITEGRFRVHPVPSGRDTPRLRVHLVRRRPRRLPPHPAARGAPRPSLRLLRRHRVGAFLRAGPDTTCSSCLDEADPGLVDATLAVVDDECRNADRLDDQLVDHWLANRNDVSALAPLWRHGIVVDTVEVSGPLGRAPGSVPGGGRRARPASTGPWPPHPIRATPIPTAPACTSPLPVGLPTAADAEHEAWVERYYTEAWDAVTRATMAAGGAISHHHGIGINRARFLPGALGCGFEVLASVKQAARPQRHPQPRQAGLRPGQRLRHGRPGREHPGGGRRDLRGLRGAVVRAGRDRRAHPPHRRCCPRPRSPAWSSSTPPPWPRRCWRWRSQPGRRRARSTPWASPTSGHRPSCGTGPPASGRTGPRVAGPAHRGHLPRTPGPGAPGGAQRLGHQGGRHARPGRPGTVQSRARRAGLRHGRHLGGLDPHRKARLHVTDASNAGVTGSSTGTDRHGTRGCSTPSHPGALLPTIVDSTGVLGGRRPPGSAGHRRDGRRPAGLAHRSGCTLPGSGQGHLRDGGHARPVRRAGTPAVPASGGPAGTIPDHRLAARAKVTWGIEAIMLSAGTCVEWLRDDLGHHRHAQRRRPTVAAGCDDTGDVWFVPALLGLGTPGVGLRGPGHLPRHHPRHRTGRAGAGRSGGVAHRGATSCGRRVRFGTARRTPSGSTAGMSGQRRCSPGRWPRPCGRPVEISPVVEATTLGAAYLAGMAVGTWDDEDDVAAAWSPAGRALSRGERRPRTPPAGSRWLEARGPVRGHHPRALRPRLLTMDRAVPGGRASPAGVEPVGKTA